MSLGTNIYFELSDDSFFAVSGALVWLPLEGKAGIDGLGLRDIFSLGFDTLFDAEIYIDENGNAAEGRGHLLETDDLSSIKGKISIHILLED